MIFFSLICSLSDTSIWILDFLIIAHLFLSSLLRDSLSSIFYFFDQLPYFSVMFLIIKTFFFSFLNEPIF